MWIPARERKTRTLFSHGGKSNVNRRSKSCSDQPFSTILLYSSCKQYLEGIMSKEEIIPSFRQSSVDLKSATSSAV